LHAGSDVSDAIARVSVNASVLMRSLLESGESVWEGFCSQSPMSKFKDVSVGIARS